jgi:hypothetical protein
VTAGLQCDTCRTFAPQSSPRWLYLVQQPSEPPSFVESVLGTRTEPLTFCSMRCIAEYAVARALVEGKPAGTEPG